MDLPEEKIMKIELLYFDGCPTYKQMLETVQAVLREESIDAEVSMIFVKTKEQAKELKFLGSPTLKINGLDVDENARSSTDYGMKCRIYLTPKGIFGVPAKETIRKALKEAGE